MVVHLHEVGAEALEELSLRLVDIDPRLHTLQQVLDARNASGHAPGLEAAAHVILVGVRDERARDRHAPSLGGLDDRVDLPRRVHDHALARLRIADEIDEVLHRPQFHLLEIDCVVAGHGLHPTPVPATALEWRP